MAALTRLGQRRSRPAALAAVFRRSGHRAAALRVAALTPCCLDQTSNPPTMTTENASTRAHPVPSRRKSGIQPFSENPRGRGGKNLHFPVIYTWFGRGHGGGNAIRTMGVYPIMRWQVTVLACLAAMPGAVTAQVEPGVDPDYCARRDADPRKCTLYDGAPPRRGVLPEAVVVPQTLPIPDPDYCSRRDADPRKCVIYDGPPPDPILRDRSAVTPSVPPQTSVPVSPPPGPLQPAPSPENAFIVPGPAIATVPAAPSSAPGPSSEQPGSLRTR
jgi:hypothetical protein